ncbi:MAG: thiol:disulfide interchange protein DsbD [Verrucomicrobia bacterium]|nr:MAG: thiol:disulfide interchange protein DsbD [Verrucomicrobiota bacterium]
MRSPFFSLLFLFAFLQSAPAQFLSGPPKAVPTLIADTSAIAPGKSFTIGIRFVLADRWHLYWQAPGDSGAAPQVEWELPPGFAAGPIQWPLPHSLKSEGDIFTNVYEGEVVLPVEIKAPEQLPNPPLVFSAKLKWYVCSETCLPGSADVSLTLPAGAPAPAHSEVFALWKKRLPQSSPAPFELEWTQTKEGLLLKIEGAPTGEKVEIFPIPPLGATSEHPETISRTFRIPSTNLGKPEGWKALVVLESGAGERRGWQLDAAFSKTPIPTLRGNALVGAKSLQEPPAHSASPAASPAASSSPEGLGGFLWAAFLGGLLLNLMPCVLPVIALKIFGFTQQAGESPRRVFRLGLAFVAGVFTFFLGLALAVIGLKAAGSGLNWGFQFQNPFILTGIIAAVFVFGLNLLGVFEITLGGETSAKLSALSSKQGYGGAFLHGAFTTLLGTSCTAPYLGVTLGFAVSQPAPTVFLIFLTIATGMSLPYLLLTSNPTLLRFLPKPGAWMERLKQAMGFFILGVAVWLLSVLGQARGTDALSGACAFLLVLGFGCWLLGTIQSRLLGWLLCLGLALGGYFVFLQEPLERPASAVHNASGGESEGWEPFTTARLASEIAKGNAVFVDFTAEWCLNCKVNERVTLSKPEVQAAFKQHAVVLLKADWTNGDPAITAELNRFKRNGVPFYLLYAPGAPEPKIFPELLTPALVLEALEALPKK